MMDIEKLLKDLKVLQEGHFLLNSGLHSQFYFEKFRILENPDATMRLCSVITEQYKNASIEWVIGPTTGGVIIAFEVARQLKVMAGFAEEREGKRMIGRGFNVTGKKILLVDDVMTTGKSLIETIDAIKEKNGILSGVAVLIDRSQKELPFNYFACFRKEVVNFPPDQCPLCEQKIPLGKLGGA